jgi:penicillin-binding protein 2
MPSEEWKIRNFRQKWYAGETISVSIGQGAIAATPIQMMRAIGGIASDGRLVRPHIVNFDNLPGDLAPHYKQIAAKTPEEESIEIDPKNWELITDAMALVPTGAGTAGSANLKGIDFAGKTGSAQTVSNQARKILKGSQYKDNAWFVGVSPRRNPDIVVCVLFEGGEHGQFAARLAAQVVKSFVDKQRKVLNNYAYAAPPGYTPAASKPAADKPAAEQETQPAPATPAAGQSPVAKANHREFEMAGVWAQPVEDHEQMGSGRFKVTPDAKPSKRVTAAPGMTP